LFSAIAMSQETGFCTHIMEHRLPQRVITCDKCAYRDAEMPFHAPASSLFF
jgi:hypothetical protein